VSESGQSRPKLRAKDSDREAVIEVLNTAFVEGQLDRVEHQRRVDAALGAPTVGSLSALTADLQLSQQVLYDLSARGIVELVPVTVPEPKTKLVWDKRRLAVLAAVLLGLGGCVVTGTAILQPDNGPGAPPPILRAQPLASVIDGAYLDDFVRAYEARFHTTLVVSVESADQGLRVLVPAVGSASRSTVYRYDGERFTKLAGTSATAEPTIDLADLDTARIGGLPDRAVQELGSAPPLVIHELIGRTTHGPGVQVEVRGANGKTITMTADTQGRVTSTSP
jgi:hypothetical protein